MVRAKLTTVKLVNRGHIGDNINSGVLSFVELEVNSSQRSKCIRTSSRERLCGTLSNILRPVIIILYCYNYCVYYNIIVSYQGDPLSEDLL